ncbi:MAG: hypothetical protein OXG35_17215 [Acidobacteria bacterium]|nr:hypothetical protein [Acidobacteriota bacterium]
MRLTLIAIVAVIASAASPAAAQQTPDEYSLGFVYGHDCCAVTGQVTDPLNEHVAVVGGGYWGLENGASPAAVFGFYGGPRLYGTAFGRLRPFWEATIGYWHATGPPPTSGFVFTPATGFELDIQPGARFRSSAGFGVGGSRGFNVTTAVVLVGLRD